MSRATPCVKQEFQKSLRIISHLIYLCKYRDSRPLVIDGHRRGHTSGLLEQHLDVIERILPTARHRQPIEKRSGIGHTKTGRQRTCRRRHYQQHFRPHGAAKAPLGELSLIPCDNTQDATPVACSKHPTTLTVLHHAVQIHHRKRFCHRAPLLSHAPIVPKIRTCVRVCFIEQPLGVS